MQIQLLTSSNREIVANPHPKRSWRLMNAGLQSTSLAIGGISILIGTMMSCLPAAAQGLYATVFTSDGTAFKPGLGSNFDIIERIANNGTVTQYVTDSLATGGLSSLATDASGNLYATGYNYASSTSFIDKITNGVLSRYATNLPGYSFGTLTSDAGGTLYATGYTPSGTAIISKIASGGVVSQYAVSPIDNTGFGDLTVDRNGTLYATTFTAASGYVIDKITNVGNVGVVSQYAANPNTSGYGSGLTSDASGNLYTTYHKGANYFIDKVTSSGFSHYITNPPNNSLIGDLEIDPSGNLYASYLDPSGYFINKFDTSGNVSRYATALSGQGFGSLAYDASPTVPAAAVPEPFTVIGTLIGGTVALRMRKKFKAAITT